MSFRRFAIALPCIVALALAGCAAGQDPGSLGPTLLPAGRFAASLKPAVAVPKKIVLTPLSVLTRFAGSSLQLYGQGSHPIHVVAEDGSGQPIGGKGAPTFSISQISGNLNLGITPPAPQHPNQFELTPPQSLNAADAVIRVTASYSGGTNPCKSAGAVCSAKFTVRMKEIVAAATTSLNATTILGADSAQPLLTIPAGANGRNHSLEFDRAGDLFVARCGTGCKKNNVFMYAPPYGKGVSLGIPGPDLPVALTLDGAGNLFVAFWNSSGSFGYVDEYAPPYTGSPAVITDGIADPSAIATDASGNLYVGSTDSHSGDRLTEYDAPISNAEPATHTVTNGISFPDAIAVNESGTIMVANCQKCAQGIGSQNVTVYAGYVLDATMTNGIVQPMDVAVDGQEDLFVFNGNDTVTEYTSLSSGATPVKTVAFAGTALLAGLLDANATIFANTYDAGTTDISIEANPYTGPATYLAYGKFVPTALAVLP